MDRAGREIVEAAGYGACWQHWAAYGIGINWPEGHIMAIQRGEKRRLEAGMTFHVVPLLLIRGLGAIGFSQTIAVTKNGVDVLTRTPAELVVK